MGRPDAWQSLESDVALGLLADGGLLLSDDVGASCAWTDLVRERRLDQQVLFDGEELRRLLVGRPGGHTTPAGRGPAAVPSRHRRRLGGTSAPRGDTCVALPWRSDVSETFSLGRIAGIRIGVNISVLVIVLIIAGGLALGRFPLELPGRSTLAYVAAGLAAAVAFLVSLLAHELAHALVARRNGIEVEGITLWLLGGVARLKGGARGPGAEFRIAGAGPLTSLVLGVLFGGGAMLATAAGADGLPVAVLAYLAGINVLLAVFNLVPAAPLDGGRLLRALLWRLRGDPWSSAVTAARAGRFFGFALIALGFLQVVTGRGLGGLWLALVGLFLVNAATAEEQHAQVSGRLGGLPVSAVMSSPALTADPDLTVERFLHEVALVQRFSTYPLVDASGAPAGLVTLNRLRAVPPAARATTRLRDIACAAAEIPVARPDEPLTDLLPRLEGCTDGRAVILDQGRVVGVVSPTDIARTLQLADLAAFDRYPGAGGGADVARTPGFGPR